MKRLFSILLVTMLLITSLFSTVAYATGDGNMEGGAASVSA